MSNALGIGLILLSTWLMLREFRQTWKLLDQANKTSEDMLKRWVDALERERTMEQRAWRRRAKIKQLKKDKSRMWREARVGEKA